MADLNTKTFAQLVQQQAAAVQARASGLIDFSVGSVVRALVEAVTGVGLWLQAMVLKVLSMTRLATSEGADADSWVADFGGPFVEGGPAYFARLGATGSVGDLLFSRLSTSGTALVPLGATVQTADGSQRFVVTLDPESADYDEDLNGYVLGIGDASITVPAASVNLGQASNVLAGTVTVINSAIVGVDLVTNPAPFVGGADAETTEAMRVRFRQYLQSLREATPEAVKYYIRSIQAGISVELVENEEIDGTPRRGFFYVVVDDGTGDPDSGFLTEVSAAVDAHRAAGVEYAVYGPDPVAVTIAGAIVAISDDAEEDEVIALVEAALQAYVDGLGIGDDVVYNRLFQVAYDASPDLIQITLTLNGGTANLTVGAKEVADLVSVTVT